MTKRLLLIEDDLALRTGLCDAFLAEGHEVATAGDGDAARKALLAGGFDLVVLDLMLPKRSGLELLRELRARADRTPVLVLTARGDEGDKVLGLELGADDYVTKPFGIRELLARVRALLRRAEPRPRAATSFRVGDATVDLAGFAVARGGVTHPLSPKEVAMLELLFLEAGTVISRERFLKELWGGDLSVGNRTIDTHVLNLRQKLEPDPREPRFLLTVHGAGYKLLVDG
jgi:two-component system alkaline phosphatase synthesis response regulator PhoP